MAADKVRLMQVLEATDGGTLHYLLDLAYNLPLRQFDIHLVVSTERNPAFADEIERLRAAGIEVSVVPMVRKIRPARDWACMSAIRDLIRSWRPDVIHSHSSKAGFLARFAARSFPCANLYTPHCFAFTMSVGPLRQALYLQLERYAGTLTDMLVLLCESERQIALDASIVPWEKITVVPTGIRPEDYQCAEDRDEIRRELGVGGFDLVLGVVGALVVQKGHTYLLSAMERMLPDVNVAAVFAGRGELEAQLREQARQIGIADRVFFLGHRADTARLYRAMDLFVLPSLWEGLPYVLMEAMVDAGADGVSVRGYPTQDGARASEVTFDNVKVGANDVFGDPENGLPLVRRVVDAGIAALAVLVPVPVGRPAISLSVGGPLKAIQAEQHGLHRILEAELEPLRAAARPGRAVRTAPGRRAAALPRPR